jgi:dolichol kinase
VEIVRHHSDFVWLTRFLHRYTDKRDLDGPFVKTHLYLLVGCGLPLWIETVSGSSDTVAWLTPLVVLCLGDSVAAICGRAYGRTRLPFAGSNNKRTVEGSVAMLACLLAYGYAMNFSMS